MRFPPPPRAAICGLALAVVLVSATARADETVEGTVVAIDHGDLVLDLGASRGAESGGVAELFRPLVLRHPITGKPLRDRFLIGRVVLGQVRGALSLAALEGAASREPAVGDIVIMARKPGSVPTKPLRPGKPEEPSGSPRAPSTEPADIVKTPVQSGAALVDEDAAAVTQLLATLQGVDPAARAARYEEAARARPQSRFARVLMEEAVLLRRTQGAAGPSGVGVARAEKEAPRMVSLALPERLLAGKPFELALRAAYAHGAVLHVRAEGASAYLSRPMVADKAGYFRLALPVSLTTPAAPASSLSASSLALFVEAVDEQGALVPLVGSASAPIVLPVDSPASPSAPFPGMLVQASLFGEYALYDLGSRQDRAFQTEGAFGLRLGDGPLRAVRSGFGVYRGVGGTLDELDVQKLAGRPVGLTYGWLEAEWAPWSSASIIGRAVIGVGRDGINGGGQGFVRIGNDRRTNLLLGGEILGGVGIRGVAELSFTALPKVPITLRTEVTNQPAGLAPRSADPTQAQGGTEVGARAIVQAGYRLTPSFVVFGRGSYQGRTIHHAGPGFGAGAQYEWLPRLVGRGRSPRPFFSLPRRSFRSSRCLPRSRRRRLRPLRARPRRRFLRPARPARGRRPRRGRGP